MPRIRHPFSISAVLFNPFAWMPAILITILWLCTFWLGQSLIATFVLSRFWANEYLQHPGTFTFSEPLWWWTGIMTLNWVLLIAWLVRRQHGTARIRRQWRRSMPIARPERERAEFAREQREGAVAWETHDLERAQRIS
ncbi:hypothetical protein [Pseudoclavibacter sp. Z016]|uniref:hypothetical protein n=1 Tax=Pseudoclavibacter sp. Z016 TaxID=2080581 RepID=UPI000CE8E147|nr:hypothetical protein [Pseudoclavibacter sp. Z016]PPF74914.1 hypothetical protein C5B99_12250 [Pseudoclavibacter sp. Z016]